MSSTAVSFTERADFYETEHAAKLGRLLPEASAKALEKVLPFNPPDVLSRARLLGYYWKNYEEIDLGKDDPEKCRTRVDHILWFIENAPDCIFAGDYYLTCDPNKDTDNYCKVRSSWENQLQARPACTQSRVNFALFLLNHDPKLATDILFEVRRIDPFNEWALSLLPLLGLETDTALPLPVDVSEPQRASVMVEKRLSTVEKMLSRRSNRSRTSRATVDTQERILQQDHFDIWARLDILRWCHRNMERANRLGFDPAVAQRWYRHALWLLCNVPHVNLIINYTDFGFGTKLPADFFDPIREAFIEAFRESPDKAQVFCNAIGFFTANIGLDETKKLIFPLQTWKDIDRKTRQKLLKELNWKHRRKTLFEKDIDLDSCSLYIDSDIGPPLLPAELSMWANDLELSLANYDGKGYSTDCASNLERALGSFETDLISTARLAGYYSRCRESLASEQSLRFEQIMKWLIENVPESDYVTEVCLYEGDDSVDLRPLRTLWQMQMEKSPSNSLIAANAASWLAHCDSSTALHIAQKILEYEPGNIFVIGLVNGLSHDFRDLSNQLGFRDLVFEAQCDARIRSFHRGANKTLAAVCDEIELYLYIALDCLNLPSATRWSNEQVLKLNPNDAIVRCEVLGWCDRDQLRRRPFIMHDPELARRKTDHILWLLENVPDADLYFFTRYHEAEGIPSHGKILAQAVKVQRKVYGKTVAKYRPEFPRKKGQSQQEP